MSFQWPLLLPLLAIVPLSVAAYVALERRRTKYAVRFTNLEVLAEVVDAPGAAGSHPSSSSWPWPQRCSP